MDRSADYWIGQLQLVPHIEGGAYTSTYRSGLVLSKDQLPAGFNGPRPVTTAIYFLLQKDEISALHRLPADEIWHFYYGDALTVYEIDAGGILTQHILGSHPENGEHFQCVVKAGSWFGSCMAGEGIYALVGCTVSPGFDFDDFEMAKREDLLQQYPGHAAIINRLTR